MIKGVVLDAEKNVPVPAASVFLSNTSIGTTASVQGTFELSVPNGKFDLIVSSVGFETFNQTIITTDIADFITIRLKPKQNELENVIIEPYEKDGWEKWGKFFTDMFIGNAANAMECKIKNTEVIHFRNSKKTNELIVIADEPLVIENKALGYQVRYQLEGFSYDFKTHYLFYFGYPFFEDLKGSAARKKHWASKRSDAYYGSMMHFMRAVYRNTLAAEGFEVRHLKKIPNLEKQRVKALYAQRVSTSGKTISLTKENTDSTDYYNRILRGPDVNNVIGRNLLPGDSIAGALDSVTAILDFNDYLLIIYTKKLAAPEYVRQYPDAGTAMASQITLLNNRPIEIQANGSYYSPTDLLHTGYWSWSEKIASMLPFDYHPPKK